MAAYAYQLRTALVVRCDALGDWSVIPGKERKKSRNKEEKKEEKKERRRPKGEERINKMPETPSLSFTHLF
jgi:hypothetical protein